MTARKRIALVVHDGQKQNVAEWAKFDRNTLAGREVWATGATGAMREKALGFPASKLPSGPLPGG